MASLLYAFSAVIFIIGITTAGSLRGDAADLTIGSAIACAVLVLGFARTVQLLTRIATTLSGLHKMAKPAESPSTGAIPAASESLRA